MAQHSGKSSRQRADERKRQERLGGHLRKMYDDVASEPVPDDFLRLLEDADKASQSDGKGDRS